MAAPHNHTQGDWFCTPRLTPTSRNPSGVVLVYSNDDASNNKLAVASCKGRRPRPTGN